MKRYFCVPSDFKKETIDIYESMNKQYPRSKIIETYGNITVANLLGSGRASSQLPKLDVYDLKKFVEYSQSKGIDFNYTINATHLQNKEFTAEGINEINRFLMSIYEAGVRSITVALPSLLEIAKGFPYKFEIKASTLCQITTVNKAIEFKHKGYNRIVLDESLNRDLYALQRIQEEFGERVELIVNPLCLKDCTYRMFHYNQITTDSVNQSNEVGVDFFEHRCVMQRNNKISNLLRMCFIRPEDLGYYTDLGINYFKLQGRHLVTKGDMPRTISAYLEGSYDGDVMDLIYLFHPQNSFGIPLPNKKLDGFAKPFFKKAGFCKRDCSQCQYCDNFARKIIDYEAAQELIGCAKEFYSKFDQFSRLLESEQQNISKETDATEISIDFDI